MNDDPSEFSLLFVDDEQSMLSLLERIFSKEDYQIHKALNGHKALALLGESRIDAALLDLKMPRMGGLAVLKEIRKAHPEIMTIMLTAYGGVEQAVEAMKLGAVDFLEKPFSPEGLRARVAHLHQIWQLKEENRNLRAKIESQFCFDQLVGNSAIMLKVKETIAQVGPTEATVLIQGETGTGKELVARAVHHHSTRCQHDFVPVDCAAISETVMESEVFGHLKGAFTGAHVSTLGLIRSADKGTLFLDEVAEFSPAIQAKLLRVLQEKEVRPVGSSRTYPVDVRILAATNRRLEKEVARKGFREDLFYRLNVLTINVPALRDRREDIALLARHFLKRFSTDDLPGKDISREALFCLEEYDWPGNIRELENAIRRALAVGREEMILPEDLPPKLYIAPTEGSRREVRPSNNSMAAYERAAIENALAKSKGNRRRAAQILGIGEATLYRKIKKYGIKG